MKTTIKPGLYKLSIDVKNPTPDKRKQDDWRYLPEWKAGRLFVICSGVDFPTIRSGKWTHHEKRLSDCGILFANLVPYQAKKVKELLFEMGLNEFLSDAIDILIADGRISIEDLRQALVEAQEIPD